MHIFNRNSCLHINILMRKFLVIVLVTWRKMLYIFRSFLFVGLMRNLSGQQQIPLAVFSLEHRHHFSEPPTEGSHGQGHPTSRIPPCFKVKGSQHPVRAITAHRGKLQNSSQKERGRVTEQQENQVVEVGNLFWLVMRRCYRPM